MPKSKGDIKTGGRQKGSKNKVTKEIKEAFKLLVEDNLDNMTVWLNKVAKKNPAKALEIILEMSKRSVPILQTTKLDGSITTKSQPPTIIKRGSKPS